LLLRAVLQPREAAAPTVQQLISPIRSGRSNSNPPQAAAVGERDRQAD